MKRAQFTLILAALLFAGCSTFGARPGQHPTGDKTVCILFNNKRFKMEVVSRLSAALSEKGYTVVTDKSKRSKFYPASDYAAVVYMAELWAWHTPWHAKRYFSGNGEEESIVFVITSGDPDVTIAQPFDAVTSASSPDRVEPVYGEIMNRLQGILKL